MYQNTVTIKKVTLYCQGRFKNVGLWRFRIVGKRRFRLPYFCMFS